MRPKRGSSGLSSAVPGSVRRFFDFLVPPVFPRHTDEGGHMELADFNLEMQYAQSWRELRQLVEAVTAQLDATKAREGTAREYATFMLERDGRHMLMGVRANKAGDEIHITQQVLSKQGRAAGEPANIKLVFDDVDGVEPREA